MARQGPFFLFGTIFSSHVSVTEISETGHDVGFFVQPRVNFGRDDPNAWMRFENLSNPRPARNKVHEQDLVFWHSLFENDLDGAENRTTCGQHRIENQDVSIFDVFRELLEDEDRLRCFLISLNKDMAKSNLVANLTNSSFHAQSSTKDWHSADPTVKTNTLVIYVERSDDRFWRNRQKLQRLLYQQTNESIRVEDELPSIRFPVPDDSQQGSNLIGEDISHNSQAWIITTLHDDLLRVELHCNNYSILKS